MLKRLFSMFGGPRAAASAQSSKASDPAEEALFRQIAERSKSDPLIGAKIGAKDVTQRLLGAMKTDRGVHVESLLCALGSLAGYSCQAALRALAVARGAPETSFFTVIETQGGEVFFFGDHLNKPLAESQYSVWSIAAGGGAARGLRQPSGSQ